MSIIVDSNKPRYTSILNRAENIKRTKRNREKTWKTRNPWGTEKETSSMHRKENPSPIFDNFHLPVTDFCHKDPFKLPSPLTCTVTSYTEWRFNQCAYRQHCRNYTAKPESGFNHSPPGGEELLTDQCHTARCNVPSWDHE